MTQIHTHYDNLKVARNAPTEVIRAAYRSLSQKYHPDRNPDDAEAARIMSIINNSYEVLSDPNKRHEHDIWVAQQERDFANSHNLETSSWVQQQRVNSQRIPKTTSDGITVHLLQNWYIYGIAAIIICIWASIDSSPPPAGPKPYQASPTQPTAPQYVRPSAAPNGQPWPISADYVNGYQQLHTDGFSSVTVDNTQNNADVFVKLVSLDNAEAYPVRQFFIPAHNMFTLKNLKAGSYDMRYRDLDTGGLSRSEAFEVEEITTNMGRQYSNITMTLYKVSHGNMQTYGLSETEF